MADLSAFATNWSRGRSSAPPTKWRDIERHFGGDLSGKCSSGIGRIDGQPGTLRQEEERDYYKGEHRRYQDDDETVRRRLLLGQPGRIDHADCGDGLGFLNPRCLVLRRKHFKDRLLYPDSPIEVGPGHCQRGKLTQCRVRMRLIVWLLPGIFASAVVAAVAAQFALQKRNPRLRGA